MKNKNNLTSKQRVLDLVAKIPPGYLATYGDVGKVCGLNSRIVGWILSGMSSEEMEKYPWQRVVAKGGIISSLKLGDKGNLQVDLLIAEGLKISGSQVISEIKWFI